MQGHVRAAGLEPCRTKQRNHDGRGLGGRARGGTEGLDGGGFVFVYFEDLVERSRDEQVVYSWSETRKLELPTILANRRMSPDQLSDARAVEVVHLAKVQKYQLVSLAQQGRDGLTEQNVALSERNSSGHVDYRDSFHLPGRYSEFL